MSDISRDVISRIEAGELVLVKIIKSSLRSLPTYNVTSTVVAIDEQAELLREAKRGLLAKKAAKDCGFSHDENFSECQEHECVFREFCMEESAK